MMNDISFVNTRSWMAAWGHWRPGGNINAGLRSEQLSSIAGTLLTLWECGCSNIIAAMERFTDGSAESY